MFKKVGNGTQEHGWAHVGVLLETFDAIFEKQRSGRHRGHDHLQPLDRHILKALLKHIDFATGALFPAHDTIASLAGVARRSVVNEGFSFVAIDRTSKLVFTRIYSKTTKLAAATFSKSAGKTVPYKIHTI